MWLTSVFGLESGAERSGAEGSRGAEGSGGEGRGLGSAHNLIKREGGQAPVGSMVCVAARGEGAEHGGGGVEALGEHHGLDAAHRGHLRVPANLITATQNDLFLA